MPTYATRPEWLRAAVTSTLAQEGVDLELLVVDDGSPEPAAAELADIDDPRLRVLEVPHGGVYAARNAAMGEIRGDVIRHVDADDVYPADGTRRMLDLMGPELDHIAYAGVLHCDADLRPRWLMATELEGDLVVDCLLGRFQTRTHTMLVSRDVAERTGPWDTGFRVSGDWDWVLRALERAPARGQRFVGTLYRRHGTAITARNLAHSQEGARRVVGRFFERHPELVGTGLERRAEASLRAQEARVRLSHGSLRDALPSAARSLAADPRALPGEVLRALPALRPHARRVLGASRASA
jgi:glycosyltransferase involved in cell wall biosynthesis